jgi:hypothetical protein
MSVVATVSEESFQNVAYVNNIPDNRQRQAWHTEASRYTDCAAPAPSIYSTT